MRSFRLLLLCLFLAPRLVLGQVDVDESLPLLEEMQLPTTEQLLNESPQDWIVMNSGKVITVESVVPRPDTLKIRQAEISAKEEARRKLPTDQRDHITQEIADLRMFVITLPEESGGLEYQFPFNRIQEIIHHEDLMIRRMIVLMSEGKIDTALELLTRLRRTYPNWPGLDEVYLDLLFADARLRVNSGDTSTSLMLIDQLLRLNKNYGGLSELAGRAIEELVGEAIARGDYLTAQFYLEWLAERFVDHPVYLEYAAQLTEQVKELLLQADQAGRSGEFRQAAELVERAVAIWPLTPGLRAPHRIHSERYQRLNVGVVDAPGESIAYFAKAPADLRKQRLTQMNFFEIERLRNGTAYYWTRFFDEWEPTDLGREMHFKLKQFRQPYEMQAVVSVTDIVTHLSNRLDQRNPEYDERLASYVESVSIDSPLEFSLTFRRVPPRIEPLLAQISVGGLDEDNSLGPVTDPGGFELIEQSADWTVYDRKIDEPEGMPKYHVAEIRERRYESYEKAAQGLRRGEVSMLPDLPDWIIRRMFNDDQFMKEFFIEQYLLPETHLLQFNPASKPLRNRELRTALAYAVNRPRLLKEVVLRDHNMAHGRIVTTPFVSSNPGRNIQLKPREYNLEASMAMLLASLRQLPDGIPPLTMIVAPDPVAEEVARDIAAIWNRIGSKVGLNVRLVYADDPAPESWDIIYRTAQLAEPLVEMWPFLAIQERANLSGLDHYPDWLKQELIELDRTSDQSRAISALQTLHRHMWNDTSVFPLWELDRFLVIRKNIQGFPERPLHCYDQIDRWTVDAWFQTELP